VQRKLSRPNTERPPTSAAPAGSADDATAYTARYAVARGFQRGARLLLAVRLSTHWWHWQPLQAPMNLSTMVPLVSPTMEWQATEIGPGSAHTSQEALLTGRQGPRPQWPRFLDECETSLDAGSGSAGCSDGMGSDKPRWCLRFRRLQYRYHTLRARETPHFRTVTECGPSAISKQYRMHRIAAQTAALNVPAIVLVRTTTHRRTNA